MSYCEYGCHIDCEHDDGKHCQCCGVEEVCYDGARFCGAACSQEYGCMYKYFEKRVDESN